MMLPASLTGSAGRALQTLAPIERLAAHADGVMTHAAQRAKGDLALQATGSDQWLQVDAARALLDDAAGDMRVALGREGAERVAQHLDASVGNLRVRFGRMELSTPKASPSEQEIAGIADTTLHAREALGELHRAANRTAVERIGLGTLATAAIGAGSIAAADVLRG